MVGSRSPRCAALLIAGPAIGRGAYQAASVLRTLGQIGEVLLAAKMAWQVIRLDPHAGGVRGSSIANVKRELDALVRAAPDLAFVIISGTIVTTPDGEAALITDPRWTESSASSHGLLPLAELRRLRGPHVILIVAGWALDGPADDSAARWLSSIATGRHQDLVAVGDDRHTVPVLEGVLAALAGGAVDRDIGTITLRSLSSFLQGVRGVTLVPTEDPETLGASPPLVGSWDPRLTRRSQWSAAPTHVPAEPEDLTGTTLPGRFRIDARLAHGSFGTVYRAKQLAVARDVAVKVLHSGVDPASPTGRLFVQEVQSVARIDHPNVVRVYHADVTSEGRLFYAMELLDGRDLDQVIARDGRLPVERAIAIVLQLLAGLGAAHEVGLVHADIKPANIVLVTARDRERVVLVDFGLARLQIAGAASASLGGTPAYMAPEQLRSGRVDARSDLFSAALVLVTLVTGWRRRSKDDLAPPLETIEDSQLRNTLQRALAIEPADRFASAPELAAALDGRAAQRQSARPAPAVTPRLDGRSRELDELTDAVLYRRAAIVVGRHGIGKTALVRAGLVPRVTALGAHPIYVACTAASGREIARAVDPAAEDLGDAFARWHAAGRGKLVLVLDDLDGAALVASDRAGGFADALVPERRPADMDIAVVACVREDAPGSIDAPAGVPVVRLDGLDADSVRDGVVLTFAARRIAIEDELVEKLLRDLGAAATALGIAGCYPPHIGEVCDRLIATLGANEARLTIEHYARIGAITVPPAAPRQGRSRIIALALGAAAATAAAGILRHRHAAAHTIRHPAPASSTTVAPTFAQRPTVVIGGSGTLLWGFFAPLESFLEVKGKLIIPITSQNDVGSGGALTALRTGQFDIGLMSRRADPDALAEERSTGKVLVEVPIGFDETSFFVRHDSPVRTIDAADVRAHLCCPRGEAMPAIPWSAFGVTQAPLASEPVTWVVFGRTVHSTHETTSATLALADEWFCSPQKMCPSNVMFDAQADEVLSTQVKNASTLALSSRSFATDQVAAIRVVDRARHMHLDGRKGLWLYALLDASTPMPAKLCRFFDVVLDPSVAQRLVASGKAIGLADEPRLRQRATLGLDDGSCARLTAGELAARAGAGATNRLASPIASVMTVAHPWVPDP